MRAALEWTRQPEMLDGLKPYPAYKESGVRWLGRIPEDWSVARNGRLFSRRNEPGRADLPILEVSLRTGVRVRELGGGGRKQLLADVGGYRRAVHGDVAYNTMRMWQGAVGVVPATGLVSPAYVVARPHPDADARYFTYLFRTAAYLEQIDGYSRGIVKDRNRLYWEDFKRIPSPVPPPEEQAAIIRFLDHAERRIRRYVRNRRKLIRLLEEEKQATILRAVTRGLDPKVRLAASGVAWLGNVPEHWRILPLSRVTKARCDGPFGSGLKSSHYVDYQGIRVIRLQNIGLGEFNDADAAFISPTHYASLGDHSVESGDVLIAGLGDEGRPAGRACVAPPGIRPAMVKADCFRFRLDVTQISPTFAAHHLTATATGASAVLSTGATRQRTNLMSTGSRRIAIPPANEQDAIVEAIQSGIRSIEPAIAAVGREIFNVVEFLTCLQTDVVTGKLDVREAAARLPEETITPDEAGYDEVDTQVEDDADSETDADSAGSEA